MTEDLTEWLRAVLIEDRKKVEEERDNPLILSSLGTEDAGMPWIPDPVEADALRKDLEMALAADARLMVHHFMPESNRDFLIADINVKLAILDLHPHARYEQPAYAESKHEEDRRVAFSEAPLYVGCIICHTWYGEPEAGWWCETVRLLAVPYVRRPGFREEWMQGLATDTAIRGFQA